MSGYPYGYEGMGGGIPPPPSSSSQQPPLPPRPPAYRQGGQQPYYVQESTGSSTWRIPYQETEVSISVVDARPSPSSYNEGGSNPSRSSSLRKPENHAVDDRSYRNYTETQAGISVSHNMAIESKNHSETQQVSDGMSEGLSALGWGVSYYDTSKPNYTPSTQTQQQQQQRTDYEPADDEKIFIDYSDYFAPSFQPAAPQHQPQAQPQRYDQAPLMAVDPSDQYNYNTSRPVVPHASASDPFPISVEHERFTSEMNTLRESQFPEPVNLGGSDLLYQPPSRAYTSYRRTPRRPNENAAPENRDANGLPSLGNIYGPGNTPTQSPPSSRQSFNFDDEKRFYPTNYNASAVSLLSTKSEMITPSSRYGEELNRVPSYASLRPDNDPRGNEVKPCYNVPPPPTGPVRYSSQKIGNMNKLGAVLQDQKMEYVVTEINRKDALHRQMLEETRRWGT